MVLITKGARVSVPEGGFVLEMLPDGSVAGRLAELHVGYEMYPQWLRLALEHSVAAERGAAEVDALWKDGSTAEEIDAVETEMRAGMQTAIAVGAAIDGFYATLKDISPAPAAQQAAWKRKKTARYKQIAEMIRINTTLKPKVANALRDQLEKLFSLRDQAIHPTGAARRPVLHPRLSVPTAQSIAMFTAGNAVGSADSAINIIGGLLTMAKPSNRAVVEHFTTAKHLVYPIVDDFEAQRGRIMFPRSGPSS